MEKYNAVKWQYCVFQPHGSRNLLIKAFNPEVWEDIRTGEKAIEFLWTVSLAKWNADFLFIFVLISSDINWVIKEKWLFELQVRFVLATYIGTSFSF